MTNDPPRAYFRVLLIGWISQIAPHLNEGLRLVHGRDVLLQYGGFLREFENGIVSAPCACLHPSETGHMKRRKSHATESGESVCAVIGVGRCVSEDGEGCVCISTRSAGKPIEVAAFQCAESPGRMRQGDR